MLSLRNLHSILSFGTLLARAFVIRSRRREFVAGSPPLSLTAIEISFAIFVNTFALAASVLAFLCLILFHLLCPDIFNTSFMLIYKLLIYFLISECFLQTCDYILGVFFMQISSKAFPRTYPVARVSLSLKAAVSGSFAESIWQL